MFRQNARTHFYDSAQKIQQGTAEQTAIRHEQSKGYRVLGKPSNIHSKSIIVGLALFSMFFGSGNLIFPLDVGRVAGGQFLWGALGFILTAVLVPFMGVVAMVVYNGDYQKFFAFSGKKTGFILTLILLSFWIPFGSGPRCITLSFASLRLFSPDLSLPVFAILYSLIVFGLSFRKNKILDILGYVLTPLLLVCLAIFIYKGSAAGYPPPETGPGSADSLMTGLLEGYNTMDLIAAFFFSSTIIGILQEEEKPAGRQNAAPRSPKKMQQLRRRKRKQSITLAFNSGLVGISILGTVYFGLMYVAASHGALAAGVPKERLLSHLAFALLGREFGILASLIVSLACLTTSIALASVFSEFLRETCLNRRISHSQSLALTCLLTCGMSMLGFETITIISEPVFRIFYPCLIILILILTPFRLCQLRKSPHSDSY